MGMILNRRRAYGGKKGLLPSGYKQLEYIENTNAAYIDTDVYFDDNTTFDVTFSKKSLGTESFLGWRHTDSATAYGQMRFFFIYADGRLGIRFGMGGTNTSSPCIYSSLKYKLSYDGRDVSVDDKVVYNDVPKEQLHDTGKFYLFYVETIGYHRDDLIQGVFDVYYLKIYQRNKLVRNMVPCKNPNNVVGMYDTVEGEFYSSPNGTAFIAGPDV